MPDPTSASQLLREVGLMADGPLPWGRPVPARGPGVFIFEAAAARATAPIELTRVGKWLERVPDLRLDGERPSSRALSARLASFWLPNQVVLYIGGSTTSVAARIAAMERTELGDRRPASGGHWLRTLSSLGATRLWWATTAAVEEYEDALLSAFAATVPAADLAALPAGTEALPFANLRRPTGERRAHGLTGSLLPEPVEAPAPPRRIVQVPDGDADGANGEAPTPRPRVVAQPAPAPIRRAPTAKAAALAAVAAAKAGTTGAAGGGSGASLTADGVARLQAELAELTGVKRPEVIGRIRAAKELGDLKENADYTSAREEQSFLEGRIKAIEATLRAATVIETPSGDAAERVSLGSTVTVEDETGATMTFVVVGSAEADPGAGRISNVSPVGKALMGRSVDDDVAVAAPRGEVRYRIVGLA